MAQGEDSAELFVFGLPFHPVTRLPAPGDEEAQTVVTSPVRHRVRSPKSVRDEEEEDDDDSVEFVGQTGSNAMRDWPHSRDACAVKPFVPGDPAACFPTCPKCFCFVCDVEASACERWAVHCVATRASGRWVEERNRRKGVAAGGERSLAAAVARSQAATLPPYCDALSAPVPLTARQRELVRVAVGIERAALESGSKGGLFAVDDYEWLTALHIAHPATRPARGSGRRELAATVIVSPRDRFETVSSRLVPYWLKVAYVTQPMCHSIADVLDADIVVLPVESQLPYAFVDAYRFRRLVFDGCALANRVFDILAYYQAVVTWVYHPASLPDLFRAPPGRVPYLVLVARLLGRFEQPLLAAAAAGAAIDATNLALVDALSDWVVLDAPPPDPPPSRPHPRRARPAFSAPSFPAPDDLVPPADLARLEPNADPTSTGRRRFDPPYPACADPRRAPYADAQPVRLAFDALGRPVCRPEPPQLRADLGHPPPHYPAFAPD